MTSSITRNQRRPKQKKGPTMNPLAYFKKTQNERRLIMHKVKNPLIALSAFLFLMGAFTPVYPDVRVIRPLTTPIGDIAFEVVGQVTNPSPTTSNQYGYLSLINGLCAKQIFTTAYTPAHNETTAL